MMRHIIFTFAFATLFIFGGQALAQSNMPANILIVNGDKVFANARAGESMATQGQARAQALISNRDKAQAELEADSKKLEGQKTLLAPEVYSTKADDLRLKQTAKNQELKREQRKIELGQANARAEINKVFVEIVQEVMKEKKATTVLDRRLVYGASPDIDITDIVLQRLDAKLKSVKVEPPATQN